jgi:hypothetical protein
VQLYFTLVCPLENVTEIFSASFQAHHFQKTKYIRALQTADSVSAVYRGLKKNLKLKEINSKTHK